MLKQKWFVEGNSIYCTEEKVKKNQDFRTAREFKYHEAVAFNIGRQIAEHIVALHNATLL